jgi:Protein of unknown function (DUF2442)
MRAIIKITDVEPLEGHWIRATFSDGAIKEIDLGELLSGGGVFEPIHDRRELFDQVTVNESGTIEWPGEVDLDSEVVYGLFEPEKPCRIERRTIREPVTTVH